MPSGHYQSKLFNFVDQQLRRLTRSWEGALHHIQVATKSNIETLLTPLLRLWEQEPGKKFLPSKKAGILPPGDLSIKNLLETVENLPSGIDIQQSKFLGQQLRTKSLPVKNSLKHYIPTIQGIATQLESRDLVLVTPDNRILDILTPAQQRKLAEKITREVGEHGYYLNSVNLVSEKLPAINRLLAKLTGDDSIVDRAKLLSFLPPRNILLLVDSTITQLEANYALGFNNSQKALADVQEKVGRKSIPQVLPQIEQLQSSDLTDDHWLAWNDLFDNLQVSSPATQQIQLPPDCIDINARFLGYEQHPLERILHWLDQALLRIEQILCNSYFFLKGLSQGNREQIK